MAPQFPIMVATVALHAEKPSKAWRYVGSRSWDPWDERLNPIQITSESTSGPGTSYRIGSHNSNSLAASSEVPTQHQRHILQIALDFHNLPFNNSTIATLCVNRCQHWWWVHNLWGCWILMAPSGNLTLVKKEQKWMSVRVVNLEGLRTMIESAKTWKLGIYLSDMREDKYMLLTREVLWSGRFTVSVSKPVSIIYPWILPAQPE